ncbi:flagellar assembly protein T N-terminal domain-containing protein [Chitinibacter sp. ZOR0017]|uniref:flagellar assembly protein T N-terminal domain-containing protein n=1 Tax=Chitinibacter sp. ZOR0017 TaxID=1339254 RepID=UPI0006483547|nr:flagellar assembly protein T N-terminal domain-containing protein [Chitinibacter sp. ZOR0017]
MIRTLIAGCVLAAPLWAAQHEGIAPLGSEGLEVARRQAIADALENAALFNGATVKSYSQQGQQRTSDNTQIRGTPAQDYTVVREWTTQSGFLHVIIDVQPPAPAEAKNATVTPAAATAAAAPAVTATATVQCGGGDYKRKLLLAHMWVQHPAQTRDLDRLPEGIQLDLMRKLFDSGGFLPQKALSEAAFDLQPQFADPLLQPERVRELARRYAVQFVVGGIVRDTSTSGERYAASYGNDLREGERKLELNIPLVNFTQLGLKATPAERRFEFELFVFDGVSGALVNRHRLAGKASGQVMQDRATSMATEGFKETAYGQLIEQKMQEAARRITQDIACIPFSARITRVEKNRVYFDAGTTSKVGVGDSLQVYRVAPGGLPLAAASFEPSMSLGLPEEIVGSLNVTQVQPLFSVGILQGSGVQAGDYVRFVGRGGQK